MNLFSEVVQSHSDVDEVQAGSIGLSVVHVQVKSSYSRSTCSILSFHLVL